MSVFDAQEEKLVHGQNQMIVNLEVSGGSGSPAPVPGVSGLGLVVMALILVGFWLRSYRRFIPA
ncbi:MAG: hypothetical protein QGI88_07095 [SAR202 cluster bacterium]|nr:hypothetical protein [SAR202 cluster bacterium]